jgi:hypothetical protein
MKSNSSGQEGCSSTLRQPNKRHCICAIIDAISKSSSQRRSITHERIKVEQSGRAGVRQMLGRAGEDWGAESGNFAWPW